MKKHLLAVALATAMLVAGGFLAFYLYQDVREQVLSQFNASHLLIARQAAEHVESYVEARAQDLRYLASHPSLQHFDAKTMPADLQATFARLETAYVRNIVVLDAALRVVCAVPEDAGGTVAARSDIDEWARRPANRQKVRVVVDKSDTAITPAAREDPGPAAPRLFLVLPLYREPGAGSVPGAGGTFAGMILLTVDLQLLAAGTLHPTPAENLRPLRMWVMDEDGTLLLQSEHPEMVLKSIRATTAECARCHVSFDYAEQMLVAKQGTLDYQLRGQPSKVAAFAPVTVSGVSWILVVAAPRDDITGFMRTTSVQALGLVGVVGIVAGIAFLSMHRSARQEIAIAEKAKHLQEEERLVEQLRETSGYLENLFDSANAPIIVWNPQLRITGFNRAAERLTGYVASEVVGLELRVLFPEEGRDASLARIMQASGTEERESPEIPVLRKDGTTRIVLWSSADIHAGDGTDIVATVAQGQDITDSRRADEFRRLQSAALQAAADAIVITDRGGVIEWVNPAFTRLSGYTAEEALGRRHQDLVRSGKQTPAFYREMWQTLYAGRPWHGEVVNRRKDGRLYTEDQTVTPIVDASGTITHFVAIQKDITEHLELEARFRQSQRMESVGQLTSGIAHDFNNLLTVINGTAELLLSQVSQDDPVHADVQEIVRAGERAATLTRQLLAFSRQQILEPRVLNLNTVVAGMESLLRRVLGEDIDLAFVPASGVGHIKADPGQIEQVITNLVVNARAAMPQGGRLTIETQNVEIDEAYASGQGEVMPLGSYVRLTVSDTGVGMSEGTRARIFEPFFTTKGPGEGTGLGLSTVYGIVKQSRGFIWVYSEVGHGTSFRIYLPRVTEEPGIVASRMGAASDCGVETILLVEDNAGLRKLATRVLKPVGYTVLEAATGEEALAVLEGHGAPVHLLLTDVVMPGISGRELAEQFVRTHPNMKTLYMSGYTADTIVRHGVLDAQTPFLHKPFTAASLLRKVREVLDSQ